MAFDLLDGGGWRALLKQKGHTLKDTKMPPSILSRRGYQILGNKSARERVAVGGWLGRRTRQGLRFNATVFEVGAKTVRRGS